MRINHLGKFIFILLLINLVYSDNYNLILLSQARGAACLDGSPAGIYINEGKGQNQNNFLLFFEGGGFCGAGGLADTLEACYQRSNGNLGSTKYLKPTVNADQAGLLSTVKQVNPTFYDWTKVFVVYCDGAQYFGSRSEPIQYKDRALYFRGSNNVQQTIKYLQDSYDIFRRNKIVITGVSAGGIATYLYSNYLLQKTITSQIYSIPDSGFFITDYFSPLLNKTAIRQVSYGLLEIIWKQEHFPLEQCLQQFNDDIIECLNAQNLIKYIKTPMLIIQSPYDQWSLKNILGVNCLTGKSAPYSMENCNQTVVKAINGYRDASRASLINMIGVKRQSSTGLWSPSCIQHGYTDSPSFNDQHYKVPGLIGKSIPQTIEEFLSNPKSPPVYIDIVNWPDNRGCNGLSVNKRVSYFQK